MVFEKWEYSGPPASDIKRLMSIAELKNIFDKPRQMINVIIISGVKKTLLIKHKIIAPGESAAF
jgi:hypothetical protein